MAIAVVVRKWGNSLGVILPQELVRKESLKRNDKGFDQNLWLAKPRNVRAGF